MVKRVLVVDDDPAQRRILEEMIKRLGYETRVAEGGEEALAILEGPEAASLSLVLLDLVMPGTDGMAVLDRLSSKAGIPPVIVQTARLKMARIFIRTMNRVRAHFAFNRFS